MRLVCFSMSKSQFIQTILSNRQEFALCLYFITTIWLIISSSFGANIKQLVLAESSWWPDLFSVQSTSLGTGGGYTSTKLFFSNSKNIEISGEQTSVSINVRFRVFVGHHSSRSPSNRCLSSSHKTYTRACMSYSSSPTKKIVCVYK